MRLQVEIDMDGAAFEEGPTNGFEVARILRRLAEELIMADIGPPFGIKEGYSDPLFDSNGNTCGKVEVLS